MTPGSESEQDRAAYSRREGEERASVGAVPTLALPKGGGAISPTGEKLSIGPSTGTAGTRLPLPLSKGRDGATPQLGLDYDSGAGLGLFGLGWQLDIGAITRRTDKGLPRYGHDDVFMLAGLDDLVPLGGAVRRGDFSIARYAPRTEGAFARIERWVHVETGDCHWRQVSSVNVTTLFGITAESRIADPSDTSRIFSWLACEQYDDRGNRIVFRYKPEDRVGVDPATRGASDCQWATPHQACPLR